MAFLAQGLDAKRCGALGWVMAILSATDPSPVTGASVRDGSALARGVCRHLRSLGFATLTEFVPSGGLRVDVIALGARSEVWIVEVKSCRADFTADRKWPGYLAWCDRFFWAVDADFPLAVLPEAAGIILADAYDAAVLRMAAETPLAPARRRALVTRFARTAAERLAQLDDPDPLRRFAPP
jgi:hypothetical protein